MNELAFECGDRPGSLCCFAFSLDRIFPGNLCTLRYKNAQIELSEVLERILSDGRTQNTIIQVRCDNPKLAISPLAVLRVHSSGSFTPRSAVFRYTSCQPAFLPDGRVIIQGTVSKQKDVPQDCTVEFDNNVEAKVNRNQLVRLNNEAELEAFVKQYCGDTPAPTNAPTHFPTSKAPTQFPTKAPTPFPTSKAPTQSPTTLAPTQSPTLKPTKSPLHPTSAPVPEDFPFTCDSNGYACCAASKSSGLQPVPDCSTQVLNFNVVLSPVVFQLSPTTGNMLQVAVGQLRCTHDSINEVRRFAIHAPTGKTLGSTSEIIQFVNCAIGVIPNTDNLRITGNPGNNAGVGDGCASTLEAQFELRNLTIVRSYSELQELGRATCGETFAPTASPTAAPTVITENPEFIATVTILPILIALFAIDSVRHRFKRTCKNACKKAGDVICQARDKYMPHFFDYSHEQEGNTNNSDAVDKGEAAQPADNASQTKGTVAQV